MSVRQMAPRSRTRRIAATALFMAFSSAATAGKVPSSRAPRERTAPGIAIVRRALLPVVAMREGSSDYDLLGNALLVDDAGHLVAPAGILTELPASLLIPVTRLGVLVPTPEDDLDRPVAETRVFQRVRVLHLDKSSALTLLELEGPRRSATPALEGRALGLGEGAKVFGFGKPGVLRYVFDAAVAARIPVPSVAPGALRYAVDARVTEACDGGVLFDPESGQVHALTLFHLKNVHRVVNKLGDFEYGPAGTALGIPLHEVRSWVNQNLPGGASESAPPSPPTTP